MITAKSDTVQPALDLASLALCRTDNPDITTDAFNFGESKADGLGSVDGLPISGPLPKVNGRTDASTLAGMLTGEGPMEADVANGNDRQSETSIQAMDLAGQSDQTAPALPSRPPPIPPRPDVQNRIKIGKVEESARQQDAAEVMGNIFDLISCAIKGEDVMREGEQFDTIKKLFYSDVTTVRNTSNGMEKLSEFRNHYLVSPGGHDRSIYATLDNDFGLGEMEDGGTRYDYIDQAAPFQIINVRRLQFEKGMPQYDRSHIGLESTLYMDRYLAKTHSLNEMQLLQLREAQWTKQHRLREVEQERQRLQATHFGGMDLAETIEETSQFLHTLIDETLELIPNDGQPPDLLPTPPPELVTALHQRARNLKNDLVAIESLIRQLESDIDNVFEQCNNNPYRLHAVFMHSGDIKGGHYWIYIYDFQSNLWRSYNDDRVTLAQEVQVFEREHGITNRHVSTGVVYVRADLVEGYTQAVCRQPQKLEIQESVSAAIDTSDAVLNSDKTVPEQIKYNDLDMIEGVED